MGAIVCCQRREGPSKSLLDRGQGLHGAQVLAWHGPLCPAPLSLPPSATAQDLKKLLPPTPRAGQGASALLREFKPVFLIIPAILHLPLQWLAKRITSSAVLT